MNAPKSVEALSGPVSGMDTSSVAGVHCEPAGSHTGGLTPLEKELVADLRDIAREDFSGPLGISIYAAAANELTRLKAVARAAIAKAEATATEARHAGQWVLVPREPTEEMWRAYWKSLRLSPAEFRAWWARPSLRGDGPHTSGCVDAYRAMIAAAPPPADPPSPAPPSSEREGSRAGDRS